MNKNFRKILTISVLTSVLVWGCTSPPPVIVVQPPPVTIKSPSVSVPPKNDDLSHCEKTNDSLCEQPNDDYNSSPNGGKNDDYNSSQKGGKNDSYSQ
jgi:hypothetical protein